VSGPGRGGLRVVEGGRYGMNAVDRLHRFQGEHPEIQFIAPHMGGRGRFIAHIPAGILAHDPREVTVTSPDLTGLMDQLDDLLPPRDGEPSPEATLPVTCEGQSRRRTAGRAAEVHGLHDG
jgi:hypothetical protein